MAKRAWFRNRREAPKFPRYSHKDAVGMFSEMAAEAYGTVVWEDEIGREYVITAYCKPNEYKWPDARIVTWMPLTYKRGSFNLGTEWDSKDTYGAWGTDGW